MSSVSIRPVRISDAAAIAAIYAPIVTDTAISFELVPPDAEEFARRITAVTATLPWLVADDNGVVVGYVYAGPHHTRAAYRWSVDTTVYLAESARGRGLGTRLYRELLSVLCDLGYVSAYAGVTLPNPGSVAIHEALGFKPVGPFPDAGFKLGRWHDVGYWHLALREPPATPEEPRTWRPRP